MDHSLGAAIPPIFIGLTIQLIQFKYDGILKKYWTVRTWCKFKICDLKKKKFNSKFNGIIVIKYSEISSISLNWFSRFDYI